ncbi:MAG TPA: O-methyltransferase [Candidatus Eremiobacteraceae bacterium]|nr:O-methyltransferase [Candidatus Eremiobacteraceae bacterium]
MRPEVRTYAHDLNGVISAVLATADLQAKRSSDADQTRSAFERIATSARKAGDLVESLTRAATVSEGGTDSTYARDLDYLERIHPSMDAISAELEGSGRGEGIPIVDRETGRFLSVLVTATQPQNILEIGTAYGYSTLWMARAQGTSGRILTIDPDRERTAIAAKFFGRAAVADRIQIVNRPALEVLPTLPKESFDMVFIDALKEEYPSYLELSVPLLRKFGVLVADNLLWGHAASQVPGADDSETTKAIRRFNEELLHHPALNATIVPIGDGLGIAAKR